jgi:lysine-N-methylase
MLKPLPRLQPSYYETFRCVGAECEDTCCRGWRIPVDKDTFEKYQACSDAVLGPKLRELVNINPNRHGDESYAEIKMTSDCAFFSDGLCDIHATLGEEYLCKNCATYPRVMCSVEGILERSLDLSCPEAARLALTNPEPMRFVEASGEGDEARLGTVGLIDTGNLRCPDRPYRYPGEVRRVIIELLENRKYSLRQRILALGRLCETLEAEGDEEGCDSLREIALQCGPIRESLPMCSTARFETAVELILARIGSDATGRRFLDCYRDFMGGLHWTGESSIEDLAARLDAAYSGPYAQFRAAHGYMLENYLVAYVFRTLFPFGADSVNKKMTEFGFIHSIAHQYQLMVVNFVVIDTVLAGLSAFHGAGFGVPEALKLMQSACKTFEHSLTYPGKALELLAGKGLLDCSSMGMLLRD